LNALENSVHMQNQFRKFSESISGLPNEAVSSLNHTASKGSNIIPPN